MGKLPNFLIIGAGKCGMGENGPGGMGDGIGVCANVGSMNNASAVNSATLFKPLDIGYASKLT